MKKKEKIVLGILLILILLRIMFLYYNDRQAEKKASNEELEKLQQIEETTEQKFFLSREEFLNNANDVIGQVEYKYNQHGDLIRVEYKNQAGEIIEQKKYQYNEAGLKEKMVIDTIASNWQEYSWRFSSKDMTEFRAQREVEDFTSRRSPSTAEYLYNEAGQLITYKKEDESGDLLREIAIKYHDNSEKKEVVEEKGSNYINKSSYNQAGELKEKIIRDDFFTELREYEYDERGNETKVTMLRKNNKDKPIRKRVSKSHYNKQDEKISDITLSKTYINDEVIERYFNYQYKYDSDGNKVESIALDDKGELLQRIIYQYDKLGNKIMEKRQKSDGTITYHFEKEYKADTENNSIIVEKEDMLKNNLIKDKYEYDEFGNLIRVKLKNGAGEIEKNKRYYYQKAEIN